MPSETRATERRLRRHIASREGAVLTFGIDDCSADCAAWVKAECGYDVPLPAYTSEAEAKRLIARAGGLLALWEEALSDFRFRGFHPTVQRPPLIGDIGLVDTADVGPVGVIFAHGGYAYWRHDGGYQVLTPSPDVIVKAWAFA